MDSLLWLLALAVLLGLSGRFQRWLARRGARQTVDRSRAMFSGTHSFVSVDPARFDWLDLRFYDAARGRLEAMGFSFLGDVEDLTVSEQHPAMRTFIRVMCGDGGRISLGIYQVRLRGPMAVFQWLGIVPRRVRVFDAATELSDGSFLATNNAREVDSTPSPGTIAVERLRLASAAEEVVERHRARLAEALAAVPGREALRVGSLSQALAAQDRMQRLKNGVMQDREALVETIRGQPGSRHAKDLFIDEVRRA